MTNETELAPDSELGEAWRDIDDINRAGYIGITSNPFVAKNDNGELALCVLHDENKFATLEGRPFQPIKYIPIPSDNALRTPSYAGLEDAARALNDAAKQIKKLPVPDKQTAGWQLGFCRARKQSAELAEGHAKAFRYAAIEGDSAIGAGMPDHPLRHPEEEIRALSNNSDDQSEQIIDIEKEFWEELKTAADNSEWIPKDHYMMNDWVSDCRNFLLRGPDQSDALRGALEDMKIVLCSNSTDSAGQCVKVHAMINQALSTISKE